MIDAEGCAWCILLPICIRLPEHILCIGTGSHDFSLLVPAFVALLFARLPDLLLYLCTHNTSLSKRLILAPTHL